MNPRDIRTYLFDVEKTCLDTLLLYPSIGSEPRRLDTVATVTSGRRRVRLILASVPFGYRSPEHEETDLAAFRDLLVG